MAMRGVMAEEEDEEELRREQGWGSQGS